MKKLQIGIYILALIVAVLYFLFALGFSTNYAIGEGYLGQFYVDVQKANKEMYRLGLWTVVLVGFSFLLNTHKNSRFLISNYIISIMIVILMVITGITTYQYMGPLKEAYLQIDEGMLLLTIIINSGEITTKNFDQGVIISFILFAEALLILVMIGFKIKKDIVRVKAKRQRQAEVIS